MITTKPTVHFVDNSLLSPTNPISVNLVGGGGTGSKVLTALMEMNHSLIELGHAGLQVRLWDDDIITSANIGRQRFAECERGLYKSVALINRINRWAGTNWKAKTQKFEKDSFGRFSEDGKATITMTCVDNVQARFGVAEILKEKDDYNSFSNQPKYWIDFGNGKHTGQVLLSTVGNLGQPKSEKYETRSHLPFITEEFGELLKQSEKEDDTPSCSLAEALAKQDLFINSTLAQMGCSLLWNLFCDGLTENRGFFLNLKNFHSQSIKL